MIGNYNDLKDTLTHTGNQFVWITSEGWSFHEQEGGIKFTAEQALSVDSFEALIYTEKETEQVSEPKTKTKKGK